METAFLEVGIVGLLGSSGGRGLIVEHFLTISGRYLQEATGLLESVSAVGEVTPDVARETNTSGRG
jgi:hypothetical protein